MGNKDIGGKYLIDRDPEGWVRWLLNDPTLTVTKILSTEFQFVTRRSDALLQVQDADKTGETFGVLVELQLRHEAEMPARVQNYCAMARQKFKIPIVPIVIYLSEPPDGTQVAANYHNEFRGLITHQDFIVVKIWGLDAYEMLKLDLPVGLLPYVPLMSGADESVIRECVNRIRQEPNHEELETILALFAMMKMDEETVTKIVRWHMSILEQSPIYQEIWQSGQEQGLSLSVLRILQRRFDPLPTGFHSRLKMLSVSALETLLDEALAATSLEEFEEQLQAAKQN